jgi:hypothetical protein
VVSHLQDVYVAQVAARDQPLKHFGFGVAGEKRREAAALGKHHDARIVRLGDASIFVRPKNPHVPTPNLEPRTAHKWRILWR